MQVSLLQWNIWYKEDIRNILSFLRHHPTDIICLQELTKGYQYVGEPESDTVAFLANELGYHYYSWQNDFKTQPWSQANAILTRFPIVQSRTIQINDSVADGSYDDECRGYIEVQIQIENTIMNVGTTHSSYTSHFVGTRRKDEEIDRLIAGMRHNAKKFIFSGDLNAAPDSKTIRNISKYFTNAGPDFAESTWTTKPFSYHGFEEDALRWRLDYVFSTPDVPIVSSRILPTDYSDHLPIVVEFKIR